MNPENKGPFKQVAIKTARGYLRERLQRATKKHHRIHVETQDTTALKQRILEQEYCTKCIHFRVLSAPDTYLPNLHTIKLECAQGRSPENLYRGTPLGTTPDCPGHCTTKPIT